MTTHLNSCCCGCSLKTGSIIIGVYNTLLALVLMGVVIYEGNQVYEIDGDDRNYSQSWQLIVVACFCVLDAIIGILLVVGSISGIPTLLKTWIVYHTIHLILFVSAALLVLFVVGPFTLHRLLGSVLNLVLNVYFILVVYSYHTELTNGPTVFPTHANHQPALASVV